MYDLLEEIFSQYYFLYFGLIFTSLLLLQVNFDLQHIGKICYWKNKISLQKLNFSFEVIELQKMLLLF